MREGFAAADGELLMILDADLTMPPEELPKFYDAVVSGGCDFANGSRLVYPMDEKATRFLTYVPTRCSVFCSVGYWVSQLRTPSAVQKSL